MEFNTQHANYSLITLYGRFSKILDQRGVFSVDMTSRVLSNLRSSNLLATCIFAQWKIEVSLDVQGTNMHNSFRAPLSALRDSLT